MKPKTKKILWKITSILLVACLLMGGSMAKVGEFIGEDVGMLVAQAAYEEFIPTEHFFGIIGDFTNWGYDIPMYDEDGDGIYTGIVYAEPGRYEFKVRADQDWYWSWGGYDHYDRTETSNYNYVVEIGESQRLVVSLDTTRVCDQAKANPQSRVNASDFDFAEEGINFWPVTFHLLSNEDLNRDITINIHYYRIDGNYTNWDVWAWADGLEGHSFDFTDKVDENGTMASITLKKSSDRMGYLIRKKDWSAVDPAYDRYVNLSSVIEDSIDVYCRSEIEAHVNDDVLTLYGFGDMTGYSTGTSPYYDDNKIHKVIINDGIKSIGRFVFEKMNVLFSVNIPNSIKTIGEKSFYDCKDLKNVYYSGTKEEWNKIIIESGNDCLKNAKIHYNSTSEEDYQRKYTKAHVDYIDDTLMNRITNDWLGYCVSGKIMGMEDYQKIKNDYNKWRLATGDYFENPYDSVVGELIYSEGSSNAWDNLAKLSILKNERSIIKKLTQIIDFGGYDFTEEEFINNYSKYLKGDVLDSNVEKILERIFDDNEEDIKDALQDFDKLGKGIKYFEKGQKVIKAARNVIKYCSAVNAYYESEEEFKQLLIELADESLRAYNETGNIEYLLLYQSLSEFTTVETEQDIVDRVVQKALEETITNIWDKIKDVTKEKINQWLMKKMAAKIGDTAATNAGSFLLGCTIGKSVGIMFMNGVFHLSDASDEYIKAYYESQMAELFKKVLAKSADALKNNQTYEQAVQFHEALQMYKSMELSVIDTLLGWYDIIYDNEEREFAIALGYDSATGKIIGKPDEEKLDPRYRLQICQLNWSYIRCPIDYDDSNNYYVVNPSDIPTNTSPVIMNICCPVNVIVKDSSDKTIVSIFNDEIIEKSDNASVIIDHTAKSVMIMGKDDYSVIVEATDNGKMDYSITQLDSDCRIQSVVSYENIELENGTLYTGSVPENSRNPAEDCALKTDEGTVECTIRSADQNSYIPVDSIELNSEVLEMAVGEKKLLCAVIQPANATVQSVLWQSSDESIAEVDEYGNITALQEGNVVIYCIPENVSATKACRVTIVPSRIKGDTNGDGTADISDALMISRYDAGLITLDSTQLSVSDVNNDSSADIADALMVARFDAGLIDKL